MHNFTLSLNKQLTPKKAFFILTNNSFINTVGCLRSTEGKTTHILLNIMLIPQRGKSMGYVKTRLQRVKGREDDKHPLFESSMLIPQRGKPVGLNIIRKIISNLAFSNPKKKLKYYNKKNNDVFDAETNIITNRPLRAGLPPLKGTNYVPHVEVNGGLPSSDSSPTRHKRGFVVESFMNHASYPERGMQREEDSKVPFGVVVEPGRMLIRQTINPPLQGSSSEVLFSRGVQNNVQKKTTFFLNKIYNSNHLQNCFAPRLPFGRPPVGGRKPKSKGLYLLCNTLRPLVDRREDGLHCINIEYPKDPLTLNRSTSFLGDVYSRGRSPLRGVPHYPELKNPLTSSSLRSTEGQKGGATRGNKTNQSVPLYLFGKKQKSNGGIRYVPSYSKITEINLITISLASANRIRQWAEKTLPNGKVVGEVINPETVHYKTLKPIKGGLFCERIFGPLKDHECACGKKFNIKNYLSQTPYNQINKKAPESTTRLEHAQKRYFCRVCDVEYTYSIIRRTQLGYIQLASPTTHVWFVKGMPGYISILLDMKKKHLQNITYNSETLTLEHSLRGRQYLPSTPKSIFESWQKIMKKQYPEKYAQKTPPTVDEGAFLNKTPSPSPSLLGAPTVNVSKGVLAEQVLPRQGGSQQMFIKRVRNTPLLSKKGRVLPQGVLRKQNNLQSKTKKRKKMLILPFYKENLLAETNQSFLLKDRALLRDAPSIDPPEGLAYPKGVNRVFNRALLCSLPPTVDLSGKTNKGASNPITHLGAPLPYRGGLLGWHSQLGLKGPLPHTPTSTKAPSPSPLGDVVRDVYSSKGGLEQNIQGIDTEKLKQFFKTNQIKRAKTFTKLKFHTIPSMLFLPNMQLDTPSSSLRLAPPYGGSTEGRVNTPWLRQEGTNTTQSKVDKTYRGIPRIIKKNKKGWYKLALKVYTIPFRFASTTLKGDKRSAIVGAVLPFRGAKSQLGASGFQGGSYPCLPFGLRYVNSRPKAVERNGLLHRGSFFRFNEGSSSLRSTEGNSLNGVKSKKPVEGTLSLLRRLTKVYLKNKKLSIPLYLLCISTSKLSLFGGNQLEHKRDGVTKQLLHPLKGTHYVLNVKTLKNINSFLFYPVHSSLSQKILTNFIIKTWKIYIKTNKNKNLIFLYFFNNPSTHPRIVNPKGLKDITFPLKVDETWLKTKELLTLFSFYPKLKKLNPLVWNTSPLRGSLGPPLGDASTYSYSERIHFPVKSKGGTEKYITSTAPKGDALQPQSGGKYPLRGVIRLPFGRPKAEGVSTLVEALVDALCAKIALMLLFNLTSYHQNATSFLELNISQSPLIHEGAFSLRSNEGKTSNKDKGKQKISLIQRFYYSYLSNNYIKQMKKLSTVLIYSNNFNNHNLRVLAYNTNSCLRSTEGKTNLLPHPLKGTHYYDNTPTGFPPWWKLQWIKTQKNQWIFKQINYLLPFLTLFDKDKNKSANIARLPFGRPKAKLLLGTLKNLNSLKSLKKSIRYFLYLTQTKKSLVLKLYNCLIHELHTIKNNSFNYLLVLKTLDSYLILKQKLNIAEEYPKDSPESPNGDALHTNLLLQRDAIVNKTPLPRINRLLGWYRTPGVITKKHVQNLIINNIYCFSHRELWEHDKDWQDFAYYYYSPTNITDVRIPIYKHRNYDLLFSIDNTLAYTPTNDFSIQKFLSPLGDVSQDMQPELYSLGMNINTAFSGAGLIQKLLNDFNYNELKKMDKQNRILLFEYNKYLKKLKKMINSGIIKSKFDYYKACHVRDVLIRRTKLTRKIFNKVVNLTLAPPQKVDDKSHVAFGQPKGRRHPPLYPLATKGHLPGKGGLPSWPSAATQQVETNGLNMILTLLPVLPPVLRPVLKMAGQFTISDLNRLYQRIIYRNERLKKFLKDPALSSSFEMKYAQRLLQEAVDNLIQNGKSGVVPEKDARGRLLKSLSDILKGKQGRFRQYLLGKRVDYSGRSVIVVGPRLKLHECGIPKEMALILYSPFLIKRILNEKIADTYLSAKKLIQTNPLLISQLLREIMKECPVLLNRAPTLHRLGFQAFQPKLVDGKAILLHPLVCPAFNADFDGDQMAVHVPITFEARAEAWKLMLARNNLTSPATGEPIILPSQDMVLGCYYLTTNCAPNNRPSASTSPKGDVTIHASNTLSGKVQSNRDKFSTLAFGRPPVGGRKPKERQIQGNYKKGSGMFFHNINDVFRAYNQQLIHIHAVIWVDIHAHIENGNIVEQPLEIRIPIKKYTKTRAQRSPKETDATLSVAQLSTKDSLLEGAIGHNTPPNRGLESARKQNLNYIEIFSKSHNVVNSKGILINQIIQTTPGKILFNLIIKNAVEKHPRMLTKYNTKTGLVKTNLINTIDVLTDNYFKRSSS
uniref:RNA polymerase beta' subunit n=1 Tax=Edaphochlamys debaryana TaxID=47281 RepID=UPI0022A802DA|nr:RNA polymerase beta' subunit [Edaphochlamys debaryana]UZS90699.1 RNA polymerase beta' subunit [Edaphochlamys debaryana]